MEEGDIKDGEEKPRTLRERPAVCMQLYVVRDDDVDSSLGESPHCACHIELCGLLGAKQVSWHQPLLRHRRSPQGAEE